MQKRRILYLIIVVLAVVMCAILLRFLLIVEPPLLERVTFREVVCDQGIDLYHDETDDVYYLFLPAYATTEELKIEKPNVVKVRFADEDGVNYGSDLAAVPLETDLTMTLTNFYQRETYTVQLWQCDQLPTVYIETDSGSLEYVDEDKENEEDASVLIVDAEGDVEFSGMSSMSGRGNSNWGKAKNPYNLKFSDSISVWDFEDIHTLCLFANYADESRIRNSIAYYAAELLEFPYASPYQNVNVYMNGEYYGLYGVATKQEYVNHVEEDGIQAVFEITKNIPADEEEFEEGFETRVDVLYGDIDQIKACVSQFEEALRTEDWGLCFSIIDMASLAEKYVFEEFLLDYDLAFGAVQQSNYLYLGADGILHCMLPWDYDRTFGEYGHSFDDLWAHTLSVNRVENNWYSALLKNENFLQEVLDVLNRSYTDAFTDDLTQYIQFVTQEVEQSWQCDRARWKNQTPYWGNWNVYSGIETMEGFSSFFCTYCPVRIRFLTEVFADFESYCRVEFRGNARYCGLYVKKDERLADYIEGANILDPDANANTNVAFSGWYTEDGRSVDDIDIVTENITFYGTWEEIESSDTVAETSVSEDVGMGSVGAENEPAVTTNAFVRLLKKVYHGLGLDAFDRGRLLVCGVFALFFLCLIVEEIVRYRKQKKQEK